MEDRELQGLKLLTADDIAQLLGRSVRRVKMDVSARPQTLPPRFIVAGVKSPRWRQEDVRNWMQKIAEESAEKAERRKREMGPAPWMLRLARKD